MVANPRRYQQAAGSFVEFALGTIFDAAVRLGHHLNRKSLWQSLEDQDVHFRSINSSKFIYELKRRNYIEIDNDDSVKLTNKARIKIVEKVVSSNPKEKKFRLVSFDIPERLRTRRNLFRRCIKRMSFRQIQKSLWVSDQNVGDLVEIAAVEYKVSEYVAYFISEKSNIDNYIQNLLDTKNKKDTATK